MVAEALTAAPDLSMAFVERFECYRDLEVKRLLMERLGQAGLPDPDAEAVAS